MRCKQAASYGTCPRVELEDRRCYEGWHVLALPLCPVRPGGSQREAAAHALRVYKDCWTWRTYASGMSRAEIDALSGVAGWVRGVVDVRDGARSAGVSEGG